MNASGSVLVDTSVVIAHLRGDPLVTVPLQAAPVVYLPWIVLGELYYGAYRSSHASKILQETKEFALGCVLVLPDDSTLEDYGRIKAELARAGTPIPENDIWIAAAAKRLDLPLVTRDQHFSLIVGLTLLRW